METRSKDKDYEWSDDSDDPERHSGATSSAMANRHGFGGLITKREEVFDLEELGRMNLKDSFISEFYVNKGVMEASGFKTPYFVNDLPVTVELLTGAKRVKGRRTKPTTTELIKSVKETKNMTLKDIGARRDAMIAKMKEYGGDYGDSIIRFIVQQETAFEGLDESKRKEGVVKFCRFLEYATLYFGHYVYENILVEGKKALVKKNRKDVADKKKFLKEAMKAMKAEEDEASEDEDERHFSPQKKKKRVEEVIDVRPHAPPPVVVGGGGAVSSSVRNALSHILLGQPTPPAPATLQNESSSAPTTVKKTAGKGIWKKKIFVEEQPTGGVYEDGDGDLKDTFMAGEDEGNY